MAKISPVSIKYVIHATFQAEGAVEKPDVIGALFGQTEGLLGEDLELRELQKEGKIGRVEVTTSASGGKTTGNIEIPTALDKTETTLIGAAIETIDRIGPSDAKISVERIEDVRGNKRDYILERARKLLTQMESEAPESREMEEKLKEESKLSKLVAYGPEKLPAGDISGEEIIVVEGRADVVNLLKNGVKNVIAMNGTKLPKTIRELSEEKDITLFLDGDRGGVLIARNVTENAKISYIVSAPDGKEVEELSKKEILSALRKKMSVDEFFSSVGKTERGRGNGRGTIRKTNYRREREEIPEEVKEASEKEIKKRIEETSEEVSGSKSAILLDPGMNVIRKVNVSGLIMTIRKSRKRIHSIVMDGTVTSPIIRAAEEKNVKNIAAKNFSATSDKINMLSL